MTKLISGRVKKIPSANVSASRYDFIKLSETEPDLGLPAGDNYLLSSNVDGTRRWVLPLSPQDVANLVVTVKANISLNSIDELLDVNTSSTPPSLGYGLIWNGTTWVPNVITVSATELANIANVVLGIVNNSIVANTAIFAQNANVANTATFSQTANVANTASFAQNANVANTASFSLTANIANTVLTLSNFTTSNLTEGNNLYFTNARVHANVIGLINAKSNVSDLTTANVVESASNLYYTNARVYANVIGLLNAKANVVDLTTANVNEFGSNLYYTNARVYANVIALLPTYTGNIAAGNIITGGSITGANLISATTISATNWIGISSANISGLTTANVLESSSNLYYTNARARLAISAGTGVSYDNSTGVVSIGQNVSPNATVTFANLNVTGFTNFYGNVITHSSNNLSISDNMIYLNSGSESSNPDLGFAGNYNDGSYHHAGFFRDASDGTWKVFDNYSPEPDANIFINTDHATFRLANIAATTVTANLVGNVTGYVSSIDNFTTSNLVEGNNLYYTNARVYSNVAPLLVAKANVADLNTNNVIEGLNLYFTNARAIAALTSATTQNLNVSNLYTSDLVANTIRSNIWTGIYTANVIESASNLYFTNARVYANVIGLLNTKANITDLTTANVVESASNLYYTNARVYANVVSTLTTYTGNIGAGNAIIGTGAGGSITGANLISANNISATNWLGLYTANVVESGNNIFYSNDRVRSNVIALLPTLAGNNIVIAANGQISAVVSSNVNINNINGNVTLTGNLNVTDGILANTIGVYGSGSPIIATSSNLTLAPADTLFITNKTNLTGNLTVTGYIFGNTLSLNSVTTNSLVINGAEVFTNEQGANIAVNKITSNIWTGLYTSNIIESGSTTTGNVFFTNARAVAAIQGTVLNNLTLSGNLTVNGNEIFANESGANISVNSITANIWNGLTTASILESASKLFYTNARVIAGVSQNAISNITVTGNVVAGNLVTTGNITGGNARISGTIIANNLIINGSEFFSNNDIVVNRITANIWTNLYTGNIIESGNTTSGNVFFSNARARNAISAGDSTIIYDPITGTIRATANVTATLQATVNNLSTTNVSEGTNLYYTNARVYSNVIALLPTLAGNNIVIAANGQISATITTGAASVYATSIIGLNTANVTESASNLYYTDARVYANVIGLLNAKANVVDLTTANVIESSSNLYYTDARARAAISAGTGVSYDNSTGAISIGQNVNTTANVTFNTMTVTGNLNVLGNLVGFYTNTLVINDPLIQLGYNNPSDAVDLGFIGHYNDAGTERHAGLFRDATDKKFKFFDNITGEPSSATIDTANTSFQLANVVATTFEGNVVGNVTGYVSSISNFTTSNLAEGNNLYYSNVRANLAIDSRVTKAFIENLGANVTNATFAQISNAANTAVIAQTANIANIVLSLSGLTTSNLIEGNNLYYTNARVYSNVITLLPTYTGNITAGNVTTTTLIANSIIGTAVGGYITGANLISTNNISSLNWLGLYTANVVETASNLYYTNARVYSNVIGFLPSLAGTGIIIAANGQISASVGGIVTATGIIGLNTANVSESASNLYYTNARVYANVIGLLNAKANVTDLTTANVIESTSNLYFTNTRVFSNVASMLATYTGNVNAGNVTTTTLYANSIVGSAVGGYITGANLISTNNISSLNWIGLYTANVTESASNLYFTNARVYSNIVAALSSYSGTITANAINVTAIYGSAAGGSITGANLISSNIITATNIIATNWIGLYTGNVIETSGNLYFTNTRARAAFTAGTGITIDANGVINSTVTGNVSANAIVGLTTSNIAEGSNLYYTNARVYSNVISLLNAKANVTDLTTANVNEFGGNLYYTNARVYANVISLLPTYLPTYTANISAGNIIANAIITSGGAGGYITGANLITTNIISSLVWTGIYTSNVLETSGNLYYTNARVFSALSGGTGVNYSNTTGVISIGQNVSPNASVTFANLVVTGSASFYGNVTTYSSNNLSISDNMIYLNSSSTASNPDLGFAGNYNDGVYAHAGFFRDASDGVWKVYDNYSPEPDASQFIDTAHASFRLANLAATTFTGNVIASTGTFSSTTASTSKTTGAVTVAGGLGVSGTAYSNRSAVQGAFGNIYLTEYTGLYVQKDSGTGMIQMTTDRLANGIGWQVFSASDPVMYSTGNIYFRTGATLRDQDTTQGGTLPVVIAPTGIFSTGVVSAAGNVIAGNVIATGSITANGLVIRGINVTDSVLTGNISAGSTSSDTITANTITSNVWNNLYTANVIETSGNLYFTNTRAINAFTAGSGITIAANGLITSTATSSGSTQLTVSSSQVLTGGNKNYTLSSVVDNANSIIVSINGMVQAPTVDYTLSGGQGLQFSANTPANALVEVKYYGYSALNPNVAVVSSSVTIPTVAGQAAYMMGANVTQAQSIMVALDGLIQRPTVDYTVNNTTITMIPAPPEGSNIEIRFFGQEAVALAGAQYTTAYISNSRTYAGGSANLDLGTNVALARNIIVNIDGVTQIPDVNYTVSGNTLSFGTSVPATTSLVEVKFFGAEAFNANLTQAMVTAVLPTVLSNDTLVRQIIRSSAYAFSRIFY